MRHMREVSSRQTLPRIRQYSHLIGNDLGTAINRFYSRMVQDLEALGYLSLVTVQHRVVVENLLTVVLAREALLNNDDRRYYRVVSQLEKMNPDLVKILGRALKHLEATAKICLATCRVGLFAGFVVSPERVCGRGIVL